MQYSYYLSLSGEEILHGKKTIKIGEKVEQVKTYRHGKLVRFVGNYESVNPYP